MRLDVYLFQKGMAESRTHAANLIALGLVEVNDVIIKKSAHDVTESDTVRVKEEGSFKTLGEIKLRGAFSHFSPDLVDKVALDVGCSNGGFSRILLEKGVRRLYALDVGECALPDDIVNDSRVTGYFNTNARNVKKEDFPEQIEFVTIDVSFISLKLILPVVFELLTTSGRVMALIKPQFEADKHSLTKSGILKSEKIREKIVLDIENFSRNTGFRILDVIKAPHPFEDKNQEYFIYLEK